MDPRLEGLFSSLEAQFGAALDRAEEEAASDLAISLRQDRSIAETLTQGAWTALTELGPRQVREVAVDYVCVEPGDHYLPTASVTFRKAEGEPPRRSDSTFTVLLRRLMRLRTEMTIDLGEGTLVGRVKACADDHAYIRSKKGDHVVPLTQIRSIRLSLGG